MSNRELGFTSDCEIPKETNSLDNMIPECTLVDPLDWLDGRKWDDLLPALQQRLIEQVSADGSVEEVYGRKKPYIPPARITAMIGLLHDLGVEDAGSLDEAFIREDISVEVSIKPEILEEVVERAKTKKQLVAMEGGSDVQPVRLLDISSELMLMKKEREYIEQIEDDTRFLVLIGVDYRQLDNLFVMGKEGQEQIRLLAADLRSPFAIDIAQYHVNKSKKARRPIMISFEDLTISVLARKAYIARQGEQLLEGDDGAVARATKIYLELVDTPEGMQKLMTILTKAKAENNIEVIELVTSMIKDNTIRLSDPKDLFGPDFSKWIENK